MLTLTLFTLLNPTGPYCTSKATKVTSFWWTKPPRWCHTCECIASWTLTGCQPVL